MAIILLYKIKKKKKNGAGWNKGKSKSEIGCHHDVVTRVCKSCEKEFETKAHNVLRGGGNYCSPYCRSSPRRIAPEDRKQKVKEWNLKAGYGISLAQYEEMLHAQKNVCAVCKKPPSGKKHHGLLFVDHDHASGVVRGLLCGACNTAIGLFKDNPEVLISAANYLKFPQNRS